MKSVVLLLFLFAISSNVFAQWEAQNFTGSTVNFQPTSSVGSFLMNFKSKVNPPDYVFSEAYEFGGDQGLYPSK